MIEEYLLRGTARMVAAFVLEPIQGWGGSVMPPDDFLPKLRALCDRHKILLMADEVLTSMGRTGKWLACEHWDVLPDVVSIGKGFGNGFPVTAVCVRDPYKESIEKISASSSYGGNPMACAAALACFEVIEEENLLACAAHLEELAMGYMRGMMDRHPIIGDVRAKGCLMGVDLVKDRAAKTPFEWICETHCPDWHWRIRGHPLADDSVVVVAWASRVGCHRGSVLRYWNSPGGSDSSNAQVSRV